MIEANLPGCGELKAASVSIEQISQEENACSKK